MRRSALVLSRTSSNKRTKSSYHRINMSAPPILDDDTVFQAVTAQPQSAIQIAKKLLGEHAHQKSVNPALYRMAATGRISSDARNPPNWFLPPLLTPASFVTDVTANYSGSDVGSTSSSTAPIGPMHGVNGKHALTQLCMSNFPQVGGQMGGQTECLPGCQIPSQVARHGHTPIQVQPTGGWGPAAPQFSMMSNYSYPMGSLQAPQQQQQQTPWQQTPYQQSFPQMQSDPWRQEQSFPRVQPQAPWQQQPFSQMQQSFASSQQQSSGPWQPQSFPQMQQGQQGQLGEQGVLAFIATHPGAKPNEVAKQFGCIRSQANNVLYKLQKGGLVERTVNDKGSDPHWYLKGTAPTQQSQPMQQIQPQQMQQVAGLQVAGQQVAGQQPFPQMQSMQSMLSQIPTGQSQFTSGISVNQPPFNQPPFNPTPFISEVSVDDSNVPNVITGEETPDVFSTQ